MFKCTLCGICCKASPVSLLPHEDFILRMLANKLGLPYKSRPGYKVFDAKRRLNIALSYVMELVDGKCVFLTKGNKCLINFIYKPLICRSYPYVPKNVKYTISLDYKLIFATAEYGLSIKCPVIEDDQDKIAYYMNKYFHWSKIYMPNEYKAAMEMEEKRNLMLKLLSQLWASGVVDLRDENHNAPIINLYDLLRTYYPNIPYILEIDKIYRETKDM
ncbi:MAG: YkgJ family cysteine cluster protein [Staphylothermus sp.]|nr:YkgJ family cysteine cluster protein [Staphylothermus sp.]